MSPGATRQRAGVAVSPAAPISRRVVVRGLLGALAGAGTCRALGGIRATRDVASWRELVSRWWPLTDPAMRDLARRSALTLAEAAGVNDLLSLLPPISGIQWTAPGAELEGPRKAALAGLDRHTAADYAAGRVRVIDRWVLSESETVMFALLHRTERAP